jgi:hypothetical protein
MAECLNANENAIKVRREHQLRRSREASLLCSASSCPGELREACQARVRDLSAAIPSIVFLAKDATGNDRVEVRVTMDGEPIGERLDGTAIPVDPGMHTFKFEVAGHEAVERTFVVGEGEKDRRETISFPPSAPEEGVAPEGVPVAAPGNSAPLPVSIDTSHAPVRGSAQRMGGIVVGAIGIAGLGLGAVSGALAASDWSSAKSACNGMPVSCTKDPNSEGFREARSATTMAAISDVGFVAGGALVVAGVVVFFTSPRGSLTATHRAANELEVAPFGGIGATGMMIRGTF